MFDGTTEYFIASLIAIVVIINPLSTVGLLLSLTKGMKKEEKHKIAFMSSLFAFCVLIFFALTGFWIFKIYSITIDAFRIAGGIVLLIIGLNMLFPKEGADKIKAYSSQIYIVPLAIPMTSGPGAITTTVLLASNVANLWQEFMLWGAIFSACAINYIVLRFSENIDKILGREGLSAMIKIMGLFVASIGVQFIITGIKAVFPILG